MRGAMAPPSLTIRPAAATISPRPSIWQARPVARRAHQPQGGLVCADRRRQYRDRLRRVSAGAGGVRALCRRAFAFAALAASCRCAAPPTVLLIAANMTSWTVAVSGSYIMNSSITFAAESGRRLRWRHYLTFIVAGIVGLIANTAALVVRRAGSGCCRFMWRKRLAILASFVVNFSLVAFRCVSRAPRAAGS